MRLEFRAVAVSACVFLWPGAGGSAPAAEKQGTAKPPTSVSVPFTLDHNRMIVEVELVRPDGGLRVVQAWVDTGNQYLILAETLARELGLDVSGLDGEGGHSVESGSPAPNLRIAGFPLDVAGVQVRVHAGRHVRPGVVAEANLPASALRGLHVVLDYPTRQLSVARPDVLKPRGSAVPCRISATTGLVQIAASVDGETVQIGLDTGSAGTWVSSMLTTTWQQRHPAWPHSTGAVGSANFWGIDFEATGDLMQLPLLEIGPLQVSDVGLLGLDQGLFDWYSKKTDAPVAGFIGANVLRRFRIEVDYPRETTYWELGRDSASGDFDIVGLTVRTEEDGTFTVAGVAARNGLATVAGVEPGDLLLRIDEFEVTGAKMGAVIDALRGSPGTSRTLTLERRGERVVVDALVMRFP